MREILFRGKNIETGEWVYGNYIEKIDPTKVDDTFWAALIHDKALTSVKVAPETVGQFTGEYDREQTKVFEGDLFKLGADADVYEVRFVYGAFVAYRKEKQVGLVGELANVFIKVIGNIHDNPELI